MPDENLRTILDERLASTIADARLELEAVAQRSVSDRHAFYRRLLNTTFHYTRRSGEFFSACQHLAPNLRLEVFYNHLQKEEATHYRLARRDLEALGGSVSSHPPARVVEYWEAAFGVLVQHGAAGGLGVSLLTENILPGLGSDLMGRLFGDLHLTPEQFSFMRVHLVADEDHGREVGELVDAHLADHGQAILQGLTKVGAPYVSMLDECIPVPVPQRIGA